MNYIQLRSDTVTLLTKQMRQSMMTSPYGDWSYGEDQSVKELQTYAAQLMGVEDAAFVPTATFGNQCALLTAGIAGTELIIRDQSHIIRHQNGAPGRVARLLVKTLSKPFGFLAPEDIKKCFRKKRDSQAPKTGILVLEYPTFEGVVPPIQTFHQCGKIAQTEGMHVHVDAARLFSGLAESKVEPRQIMRNCNSLTICLSKGLLAPVGSVVVGSKEFMVKFKANRKMMGGVLRKPGVVAGAALIALKKGPLDIWKDNDMAKLLATKLSELGWIEMVRKVETNMVYYKFTDSRIEAGPLQEYLFKIGIFCWIGSGVSRFVIHHYIRQPQIQRLIAQLSKWKSMLDTPMGKPDHK